MRDLRQTGPEAESGFILLAVLFLMVLILIGLAVAAPSMARSIQRDKELELVHRGEQYKRAIKLYYKKFGAYPTSIDQLLDTNNIRFLRKRYTDPITGKDDWRIIYFGQAKVPPMGLFGQPLALAGPLGAAVVGAPPGSAAAFGATSATPAPTGSVTVDTPDSSNPADSGNDSGSVDSAASNPSVTITGGASATPSATQAGTATPTNGTSPTAGTNTSAFGSTLGGGPIVGVGIPVPKASLIEYKKQKKYNQWEFVYNPIEDQLQGAGLPVAGTATPNAAGVGNYNGAGTAPSTFGTTPTTPGTGGMGPGPGTTNTGPTQQQQ